VQYVHNNYRSIVFKIAHKYDGFFQLGFYQTSDTRSTKSLRSMSSIFSAPKRKLEMSGDCESSIPKSAKFSSIPEVDAVKDGVEGSVEEDNGKDKDNGKVDDKDGTVDESEVEAGVDEDKTNDDETVDESEVEAGVGEVKDQDNATVSLVTPEVSEDESEEDESEEEEEENNIGKKTIEGEVKGETEVEVSQNVFDNFECSDDEEEGTETSITIQKKKSTKKGTVVVKKEKPVVKQQKPVVKKEKSVVKKDTSTTGKTAPRDAVSSVKKTAKITKPKITKPKAKTAAKPNKGESDKVSTPSKKNAPAKPPKTGTKRANAKSSQPVEDIFQSCSDVEEEEEDDCPPLHLFQA
jgi:hypothetical protein